MTNDIPAYLETPTLYTRMGPHTNELLRRSWPGFGLAVLQLFDGYDPRARGPATATFSLPWKTRPLRATQTRYSARMAA